MRSSLLRRRDIVLTGCVIVIVILVVVRGDGKRAKGKGEGKEYEALDGTDENFQSVEGQGDKERHQEGHYQQEDQ